MATKKLSVEDQLDIQTLLNRYCFSVDRAGGGDEFGSLFTEDAVFHTEAREAVGDICGWEELRKVPDLSQQHLGMNARHRITNVVSTPGDAPNEAIVESYGIVTDWAPGGGKQLRFVDYKMKMVKIDGDWKIKRNDARVMG